MVEMHRGIDYMGLVGKP